jgi:hypothetical protein
MAECHGDTADASFDENGANGFRMCQRNVRVIDERVLAIDDGVAGDAERKRTVVDPVAAGGEAVSWNTTVIEGQDRRVGLENTEMHHRFETLNPAAPRHIASTSRLAPLFKPLRM